uniref:Uncharacterized protein n=1 Tax=Tetranychus urticae TaxID=32264 RepID=T1JZ87_TETUR
MIFNVLLNQFPKETNLPSIMSSNSPSTSSLSSFLPSISTNLWNQLSNGNRRVDEQLEQGPIFLGGSFDFDLNELAHLIQPMYNLIKNSEIVKVDQGGNRGNSGNHGGNNNDQMLASASKPGWTFSPSFGSGSTQIKPLITLAVPEIEFLNSNNNNNPNHNGNLNMNNNNQPNSHRISSHQLYNSLNGRPVQGVDPYLASASGDLGPLSSPSSNFNNINRGSSLTSTNGRRKKKRKPNSKSKRKPLIQIVDDEEDNDDHNSEEDETDSLIPMSSNAGNKNNNGDEEEDDRKDSDENQALDQILEMGLPNFLLEEVFGLNRKLLRPGKILAHLTFGALARGMIKRFFKTFLSRSSPERGLLRRVADKSCRSVKGLSLRDSVILPLGVAVTLHPLLLPLMPFMLFTLGSLKAIESATCYVSHAFR